MPSHFRTFGAPRTMPTTACRNLPALVLLTCLAAWGTVSHAHAQAQQTRFDIWKGDAVIGSVLARRTLAEERTHYLMTSYSEFDLVWKQVVSSLVSTEYRSGSMARCNSHMKVNGSVRDSSHFSSAAEADNCFVHPNERFSHTDPVEWTTARMYFEEPVGQTRIFVESVLRYCPLRHLGGGEYRLELPDDKVNRYVYENGRLEEIHVDRSLFDLVFKRDT
ncbi:MAG: DUF6134 family protein [Flavobacteriales bacterium]